MKQPITTNTGIATLIWIPTSKNIVYIQRKIVENPATGHIDSVFECLDDKGNSVINFSYYLKLEYIGLYHSITEEQAKRLVNYSEWEPGHYQNYMGGHTLAQPLTALESLRSHKEANDIYDKNPFGEKLPKFIEPETEKQANEIHEFCIEWQRAESRTSANWALLKQIN